MVVKLARVNQCSWQRIISGSAVLINSLIAEQEQPWLKPCMSYDTSLNCLCGLETLCAAIYIRVCSRCVERYCLFVVYIVFMFHLTRWVSASTPSDSTSCSISWVASSRYCHPVRAADNVCHYELVVGWRTIRTWQSSWAICWHPVEDRSSAQMHSQKAFRSCRQ